MRILDRRVHLLLDERRYDEAARVAQRHGVLVAEVIRQAIDGLPDDGGRRRTAFDAILAAPRITLPPDPSEFPRTPALGAFDAVLAAVAVRLGADALISADRAFGAVPGLRWVDPASDDIAAFI